MADAEKEGPPLTKLIGISKDLISLLRDLSLLVLTVLLILFPKALNSVLTNAGFEEGSLVGFKWKAKLVDYDTALRKAQEAIESLQGQNNDLIKALADANANLTSSPLKNQINKLEEENTKMKATSQQIQSSVAETISSGAPLVEIARSATRTAAVPSSGFCYQEDRLQDGPERYSVHCHSSKERCETARGPNARWKQSSCEFVDLNQAVWKPRSGGYMGAWYEFQSQPFGKPFPKI
jgi:hypothetical protein